MSRQIRFWLVWGAIPFVVLASLCLPLRMQPEWSHVLTIVLVIAAIVLAIEIFEHSRETAQDRTAEAEIDDHELAVIIVAGLTHRRFSIAAGTIRRFGAKPARYGCAPTASSNCETR